MSNVTFSNPSLHLHEHTKQQKISSVCKAADCKMKILQEFALKIPLSIFELKNESSQN